MQSIRIAPNILLSFTWTRLTQNSIVHPYILNIIKRFLPNGTYITKSEMCKDIPSSWKSGYAPLQNTTPPPVLDALIVVGCDDDIADAGAHADGNDLFVLGELLDPVFKDEPLPAV